MKINRNLSILCAALAATGLAGCSSSDSSTVALKCFTADGQNTTSGSLYSVDLTDGTMATVGAIGYSVTGMAFSGSTLYAVESTWGDNSNRLLTIDTTTGAGTVVGALDDGTTTHNVADITFSGGVLYGWTESGDDLVTIDTATGQTTVISSLLSTLGSGLADIGGTLHFVGTDDLLTLNKADATGITVGTPTWVNNCNANSMTTSAGMLYALDTSCSGGGSITDLVSIDPADATLTSIATYGVTDLDAIACTR